MSKSFSAGGAKGQAKGAAKGPWRPEKWQIGAMIGGGVFLVLAAVGIVAVLGPGSSDNQKTVKAAPAESTTPRFGPGSFTGTIDDVTTHSPLGARTTAQVPLERHGDLLLVDVKINGQAAGKFLVDTGVFDTIISTKLADQLKLPEMRRTSFQSPAGKQPASERKVKSLGIGSVEFEDRRILPPRPNDDWSAQAIDLKPWQDAIKIPIAGVIGSDVLYQMPVSINAAKKTLTFFNRHKFTLSNNQHPDFLSLIDNSKKPCVSAGVNKAPVNDRNMFLLATGAPTGVMMPGDAEKVTALSLFGQDFADPSFEKLATDNVYSSGDTRQVGVIGSEVLANFELLLDFQNNKVTATRLAAK